MIQTTNIRRILDRVKRHPMLKGVTLESAIEYAVDFISALGIPSIYEEKVGLVRVKDWRGDLPCDFESMIQVRNVPRQMGPEQKVMPGAMYRYATGSFHMSPDKSPFGDYTYKTQGMCIYTSTKNTMLEIAYRAFAVDNEGYPLLPDNSSFLIGLENYIKYQWFSIEYDRGKLSRDIMDKTTRDYATTFRAAQSEFNTLDLDKAESLSNSLKMLLPRNHEHWRGFATNGVKEQMDPGMYEGRRNAILDDSKILTMNNIACQTTKVVSAVCEAGPATTSVSVVLPSSDVPYIGAFTLLNGEIFDSEIIREDRVVTARWSNLVSGTVVLNALYKSGTN